MIKIDGVDPKMIANNLIPFEPTHPGEVLKDEIEFRGISQKKLAKEIGVSYTVLNEILNAKRSLNTKLNPGVLETSDIENIIDIQVCTV